ncbi:MAG: hypothetical protein D6723_10205 [Acidobacteria bacterium]|nr:MAG: hypothetical protein D6723_10205 [Acidobacteriota bacterium]
MARAEDISSKLRVGQLIPAFRLPAVNRPALLGPWDYKQRRNLVLFFFHGGRCSSCCRRLAEVVARYAEFRELEAEVLAISPEPVEALNRLAEELAPPFPLLADARSEAFHRYVHWTRSEALPTAVFIADRWGELVAHMIAPEADRLPSEREIRAWLQFIEIQCPECHLPEWPMER